MAATVFRCLGRRPRVLSLKRRGQTTEQECSFPGVHSSVTIIRLPVSGVSSVAVPPCTGCLSHQQRNALLHFAGQYVLFCGPIGRPNAVPPGSISSFVYQRAAVWYGTSVLPQRSAVSQSRRATLHSHLRLVIVIARHPSDDAKTDTELYFYRFEICLQHLSPK